MAYQDAFASLRVRRVEDGVHLLRMLHAIELDHREGAPRGGLPMDVLEAVPGHVLAQVVELPPLADLAAHAQTGVGGLQEQRGGSAVAQVGVNAERKAELKAEREAKRARDARNKIFES